MAASVIGLAVIALSAAGCSQNDAAQEAAKSKAAPGVPVVTAQVVRKPCRSSCRPSATSKPYTAVWR